MEVGTYSNAEFFEDVMQVTEYAADKKLTNILVDQSYATVRWLTDLNVKWILSTSTHAVKTGGKIKISIGTSNIGERWRFGSGGDAIPDRGEQRH